MSLVSGLILGSLFHVGIGFILAWLGDAGFGGIGSCAFVCHVVVTKLFVCWSNAVH